MTAARLDRISLALRIAAASALFGLVAVALAFGLGYWALSRQLDARVLAELEGKRALLQHVVSEVTSAQDLPANSHRFADLLIGHDDLHLAILDPGTGRVLASSSPTALESPSATQTPPGVSRWQSTTKKNFASIAGALPMRDGRSVRYVLSLDLEADQRLLAGVRRAALVGLPLVLVLVMLGAWLVARTGLRPLRRFTRLAASVNSQSLGQRLDTAGLPPELRELATDFNAMLERIDRAVTRLSEFSGDLAHEMRTPVATLVGQTQVALSKERTGADLRQVLEGNVDELDRLTRLIADMLLLAQTEQGASAVEKMPIKLGEEAQRVAEFLSMVAEDRGLKVVVTGDATVMADRLLVQRAITNLLSNAIRHATASSAVEIDIHEKVGTASLTVRNRGHVIPPDQLDRIFERFVRLDSARTRSEGGTGLGLAIVKTIMAAHDGRVHAESGADGVTTFTLTFPKTQSST